MASEAIERAPFAIRLAAVLVSLVVFLAVLGYVAGYRPVSWAPIAALLLPALAVIAAVLALRLRAVLAEIRERGGAAGERSRSSCNALVLDLKGGRVEEASRELSKIVEDRARRSSAKFALLTGLSGSLSRTALVILGEEEETAREASILKKVLPAAVSGLRVVEDNGLCVDGLKTLIDRLSLSFGSPLLYSASSPPPCSPSGETVFLGDLLDYPGGEFRISRADLSKHIAVFGSTGSGKSTTLAQLAIAARELGYSVLILDWTGEYSSLLPPGFSETLSPARGEASINPLESVEDEEMLLNIMSKALSLTGPQSYMLMKAIEGAKLRSLRDLEARLEELPEESRWDRDVKKALLRKIGVLTRSSYTAFSKTSIPPLEGAKIVRMSDVRGWIARKSYALFLLASLFAQREREGSGSPLLIIVDEAHNILSGEETLFVEQLFAEARKYGLSIAVASQSPSSIPNGVLLNANTKIVHALKSARDKNVIAETMSLSQEYLEILDKLEPGVALAQIPSCSRVMLVRVKKRY